jgi:cytohesin
MFIHWGTDEDIREYEVLGDNTAFDYALDRGHIDIVRLFLEMDSSSVLSHISPVPLLMAAKNNSARAVEVFLQHGAQVNSQDNNGRTALFWAAVNDSEEIAGMLLRKAADVDLSDQYGATPLHMAAECGSQRVLEALVRHGASLSAKTKSTESRHSWYNSFGWGTSSQTTKCTAPSGSTPLHVAVRKAQSSRIVQILIDAGAAVDAKDDDGRTVFFVATENMNLFHLDDSELTEEWSIARLLLSRGASLNTCDNKGVTLLMKATEARNPEAVRWLLNNHTVVNVRDSKGQCAVHKVFDNYSYDEDVQGTVRRVLEILHSHGANFNTRDIEGNTPLFSAVQSNPVHALDALRQFGADVTAQNDIGSTLLHHFLDGDHWEREPDSICETTTWLLDANIPIESRNSSGETALLIAATRYYPYVVRLLANRGADMTARNHKGQTALFKCLNHYGKTEEKTEMVRTLIELGAVVNDPLGHGGDLVTAASEGPADLFDLLVTRGLNINLPDVYGSVPLVRSISRKDTTWTERLLNAGADVKATNSDGTTALHQAASYQSIANARLLVPRGSKVAQADRTGRTALHIALSTRNSALTDYLLEEWISQGSFGTEKELIYMSLESQQFGYAQRIADARDPDGRKYSINFLTELYSAAIQGSSDLVLALLRQGHDNIDQTWLIGLFRIAITLRYKDTLQALLDFGLNVDGIDFLGDAPIHIAARSEHEDLMCVLLDAHAQIETLDRSGNTPLLLAVEWGRTGTVEKLLERGANVSQANCDGDTALHLTPTSEIAEVLINAQADVNALNTRNKTPLHSQDSDSLAIAQCLLDAGANVNAKDSEGNSPLHNASLYDTRILELFLKYSPDMTLTDGKGRTPLQIAVASSDKESQAILRKYLESHTKVITSL